MANLWEGNKSYPDIQKFSLNLDKGFAGRKRMYCIQYVLIYNHCFSLANPT